MIHNRPYVLPVKSFCSLPQLALNSLEVSTRVSISCIEDVTMERITSAGRTLCCSANGLGTKQKTAAHPNHKIKPLTTK